MIRTGTLTITADSVPVVDVRLTLSGQVVDGVAITHNGETLTWQEVANSNATASRRDCERHSGADGDPAQCAGAHRSPHPGNPRLPGDGTPNLDHGADDKLNLSLPVKVTDSDGSGDHR